MDKQPKILVMTVSAWNDKVGSNTWTTLLQGYESENIANLCIRDEIPNSRVCSEYFSISENKVLKSIFKRGIKTGRKVESVENQAEISSDLEEHNERYRKMRKKRRYSMLMARELIWKFGNWHTVELDEFLDSFKPDIILHSMEGYIHLNRIIEYSINRTGAKAVGYIWDDNFTYKQSSKIGYKIYRYFQRKSLKRLAKLTQAFFAISDMTKNEADDYFGIDCQVLTKPLNQVPFVDYKKLEKPIKILYTGNLLIGRDQSLVRLVNALKKVNKNQQNFTVDVYTKTVLDEKIKNAVDCDFCHIHEPVPQSEVLELQKQADVLLFLEDIDGPDAHTARLSFSTKITDYLSSGKCIFAIGCLDTAPMQYFIDNDAAVVASNDKEIEEGLLKISSDTDLLIDYAQRARELGIKNHSKDVVLKVFDDTIRKTLN